MFPQGNGFVLVFNYMLSDLAEVIRNSDKPLTEVGRVGREGRGAWFKVSISEFSYRKFSIQ